MAYRDKDRQREWPFDDSWQLGTEDFEVFCHGLGSPAGPRVSHRGHRVYLRSERHKTAIYLFGGPSTECLVFESKFRGVLEGTAT